MKFCAFINDGAGRLFCGNVDQKLFRVVGIQVVIAVAAYDIERKRPCCFQQVVLFCFDIAGDQHSVKLSGFFDRQPDVVCKGVDV